MSRHRLPRRSVPVLTLLEDRSVPAGFTAGSIQGQDGWSGGNTAINPAVAQRVDMSGTLAHTGTGSFVVSNNTSAGNFNGGFAGWPFGPALAVTSGEPASGAATDVFTATLWFRSVSTTADGSNIEIDLGNVAGTDRVNYLAILNLADGNGGLQIEMTEPDGSGNLYFPTAEATNLARGVWHRLDITANFRDAAADTFSVVLDGTQLPNSNTGGTTYDTFERFYAAQSPPTYPQVNRLFFRSDTAPSVFGFSDTGAQGFAFDDISYSAARSSATTDPLAYYFAAFETTPSVTFVDPSFAPLANGTPVPDADPFTPGAQPAIKGVDAFGTLAEGTTAVADGGQVLVFSGSYTGGGSLSAGTTLALGGPNGTAGVTVDAFAFAGGSILALDINGTAPGTGYDQFTATGGVDIGGAVLQLTAGFTPPPAAQFVLVQSAAGVVGQFANLPEGSAVNVGGLQYRIRYSPTLVLLELDRADVAVTVTDNRTATAANGVNTYTVVVSNNGPRTATGAQLSVQLPAGFIGATYTSVATGGATGNTASGGGGPADVLTLPAGATVTYTITGLVTTPSGQTLTATANITLPPTAFVDPVPVNNTATDTTTVFTPDTTRPTVQVVPNGPLTAGTPATFSLLFSEPVTGLTASDLFFSNASFVSLSGSGANYTLTVLPNTGQVEVRVAEGAATDPSGNPSFTGVGVATAAAPITPVPPPALRPRFATAVGGVVTVFDPATGTSREFTPYPGFGGGATVATADLNGDGFQEVVTGAGPGGGPHVKVFDGVTGDEVLSFYAYAEAFKGGVNVAAGGGRIVTGAGAGAAPHVRAFNLAGTETASFYAYAEAFKGGVRVAIGDTDGDGTAEIVTGAGPGAAPHVKVFAGGSLAEVNSFFPFAESFNGGVYVAAGGGRIAVGAGPSVGGTPHVKTFTNRGATEELSFFAYSNTFPGGVRVALRDADGNGTIDLVTGAGPGAAPHVRGFTLPGLVEVASFYAGPLDPNLGVFVG